MSTLSQAERSELRTGAERSELRIVTTTEDAPRADLKSAPAPAPVRPPRRYTFKLFVNLSWRRSQQGYQECEEANLDTPSTVTPKDTDDGPGVYGQVGVTVEAP